MKTKFTISEIYERRYFCNTFCNLRLLLSGLIENSSTRCYINKIISILMFVMIMLSISLIINAQQINEVNNAIKQLANSSAPFLQQQAVELNQFVPCKYYDAMVKTELITRISIN
jgi:hypothetical protein